MEEKQDNELMLGFRKLKGINLNTFKNKYNDYLENIYDIDKLLKDKYLIKENNYLRINKTRSSTTYCTKIKIIFIYQMKYY